MPARSNLRLPSWRRTAARALRPAIDRVLGWTGEAAVASEYPTRPRARWGWGAPAHAGLEALLAAEVDRYKARLVRLHDHERWFSTIPRTAAPGNLAWDNTYWGGLDAAIQCQLLIERDPATYFEVGSGYSTMFARRAIRDHGLRTRIVSIDPHPRAEIDDLCDEVVRVPLEELDLAILDQLDDDDVVLIDGSHLATMNSDGVVAALEVLPALPQGVVAGIDDVFLPWDYHPTWVGRGYGEHYLIAALLMGGGGGLTVDLPGLYVTQHPWLAELLEPLWSTIETHFGRVASTMWLERQAVPIPV